MTADDGNTEPIVVTNLGTAPVTFTLDGQTLVLPPGASVTDHCPGTGGGAATRGPMTGVRARLFDLDDPAVRSATGGGIPRAAAFAALFDTMPPVSGCVTDGAGTCSVGTSRSGDYVLITKYEDPDTGQTVYAGRMVSAGDFFDGLAEVQQQIIKVFRRGTFEEYRGGSQLLVAP